MKRIEYVFSTDGIKAMYNDSLNEIFSALEGENEKFSIEDLDIKISIGDKFIAIPIYADAFELIFDCMKEINKDLNEGEE